MIDLHIHSSFSDGSLTPDAILYQANQSGLKVIAITDHDTLEGTFTSIPLAKSLGIHMIPGLELSTHYQGRELHLLGYGISQNHPALMRYLTTLQANRKARTQLICHKLAQCGIHLDQQALGTHPNQVVTRAHFAQLLLEQGHISYTKEAFLRFLGEGRPAFVPKENLLPIEEAISLIHEAGGVAILAHPTLYKLNRERTLTLIDYLTQRGLDGLECYYPAYTPRQSKDFLEICHRKRLIVTGGSDFHGSTKPKITLGLGTDHFSMEALAPLLSKCIIQ